MKLNYKIDDMELETIVDDDTKFFLVKEFACPLNSMT